MPEIGEIVVVCEPEYREVFLAAHENMRAPSPPLVFALPGKERQDSVYNGLKVCCWVVVGVVGVWLLLTLLWSQNM